MASVRVGESATFSVVAFGEGLTYQWFGPGGSILSDIPGEITGALTSTLQISNVQLADEGGYQVQVSNAGGSVQSDEGLLTIGKFSLCLGGPINSSSTTPLYVSNGNQCR